MSSSFGMFLYLLQTRELSLHPKNDHDYVLQNDLYYIFMLHTFIHCKNEFQNRRSYILYLHSDEFKV